MTSEHPLADDPSSPDRHREQQIAWNRQTAGAWPNWTDHRRQIGSLLCNAAQTPEDRLGIFGAGNCNDFELSALLQKFARVELLDWDREAVLAGVARQELTAIPQIQVVAPIDLRQPDPGPPRLEVAASIGMLSQWMLAVAQDASLQPPEVIAAAATMRRQHLENLLHRLQPGGRGLVTFEYVSSDTLPALAECSPEAVSPLTMAALATGNFYTGLHPAAVLDTASKLAAAGQIERPRLHSPWQWHFGVRTYAVTALSFEKSLPAGGFREIQSAAMRVS